MTNDVEKYTPDPSGSLAAITGNQLQPFMEWSKAISHAAILPDALRGKPADVLIVIMHGLDVGLKPTQALQWVYVVKGRPSLSAEGMRALLARDGHEFRVVSCDDTGAVVEGRRNGHEQWHRAEFTQAMKQRAKLSGANWDAYPEDMYLARATTRLCKRYFADVIGGLGAYEDLLDASQTPAPSLGDVAAAREARQQPNDGDVVEGEVVDDAATRAAVLDAEQAFTAPATGTDRFADEDAAVDDSADLITPPMLRKVHALFGELGITDRDQRLRCIADAISRQVASSNDVTKAEGSVLIDVLQDKVAKQAAS